MTTSPVAFTAAPAGSSTPAVSGGTTGLGEAPQSAIDRLPAKAQERLLALTTDHGRDRAAANAALDYQNETLEGLNFDKANFEQDRLQHIGLHIEMAADRRAEHEGRIARAKAAHDDAAKAADEANRKANASRETLNVARGYVNFTDRKRWEFEPGTNRQHAVRDFPDLILCEVDAPTPEGKTDAEMAAEVSHQASRLAEVKPVKGARNGPEADYAAFAESLEKDIAEPDFTVMFNGSTFDLRLPIAAVDAEPRGKGVPYVYDLTRAFKRANKDAILSAAREAINDFYTFGDVLILTAEEKRARLREIADDVLASQRREAEYIWMARAKGQHIAFRPGTDPRAILGVDGPPPPKARR